MIIQGKRIILRAIEDGDVSQIHAWSNDPAVVAGLGDVHFPSSLTQQMDWFKRLQSDDRTIRLAVQHVNGDLLGYTGYWNLHWRDRRAEHATVIGNQKYARQGFGREVIATSARYAFLDLDFWRLDATILASNVSSLKAYQTCGYRIEGTMRGHALRGGQRVDRHFLGLTNEDYKIWAQQSGYWEIPG